MISSRLTPEQANRPYSLAFDHTCSEDNIQEPVLRNRLEQIHMTGTMTNPMSEDLRLWMQDRLSICPGLTFVRFIAFLLLPILNCSTLSLNKTLDFLILMVHLVPV